MPQMKTWWNPKTQQFETEDWGQFAKTQTSTPLSWDASKIMAPTPTIPKAYDWGTTPSATSQFTGAVGGNNYAATPGLNKYEPSPVQSPIERTNYGAKWGELLNTPIQSFTKTPETGLGQAISGTGKVISDWLANIKMPWDTTPTQNIAPTTPTKQASWDTGIKPFWEPQPVGALGEESPTKSMWDTEPTGPYQTIPTGSQYKGQPQVTDTQWEATPFKNFPGYGTGGYLESPKDVFTEIVNKESSISDEDATNYLQDSIGRIKTEQDIVNIVGVSNQRGLKPPTITPEKLNLIQNEQSIEGLWDYGYKIPRVTEGATNEIAQINAIHNGRISVDQEKLSQLDYNSLVNVLGDLSEFTASEWKEIEDRNMTVTLKTTRTGVDAFGKTTYSAKWDIQEPYKTEAEQTAESKAKQATSEAEAKAEYWSADAVAERNKRRQESADWSDAQSQQGWSEFYKILGGIKLAPNMDEYFNNPTMFNELRRQWQTSGSGMSWDAWLAQYDFKKEFNKLTSGQRGERPALFAPRMRSIS